MKKIDVSVQTLFDLQKDINSFYTYNPVMELYLLGKAVYIFDSLQCMLLYPS